MFGGRPAHKFLQQACAARLAGCKVGELFALTFLSKLDLIALMYVTEIALS
jgi:hypothetical protein